MSVIFLGMVLTLGYLGAPAAQAAKAPATGQTASQTATAKPAGAAQSGLEIVLEKKLPDGKIQSVPPDHVFEPGDVVHFKVTSASDGYLYVMDQGTSGRYATVFPSDAAGSDNRVLAGQAFTIPSGATSWFEISGPGGFDIVYFLLSPAMLGMPAPAAFVKPGPVSSLMPRCNDAIFRSRGECTDISAGPAPLPRQAELPAPLAPLAGTASRDITVVKKDDAVTISGSKNSGAGASSAPIIYTFRLAHH